MKINSQKGLTLVELLIAAFLGLLLTATIGAMYVTSVSGFRSTNELSRVQENNRFAMHFLQQSIRQAGYSLCGNRTRDYSFLIDPFNSTVGGGLVGYEFDGTSSGESFDLTYVNLNSSSTDAEVVAARAANAGNLADWNSAVGLTDPAPDLTNIVNNFFPVAGSDIIAVTMEQLEPDMDVTGSNANRLNVTLLNGADALPQGAIVKAGDCVERNVFVKENTGANINANNGTANGNLVPASRDPSGQPFSQAWDGGTTVYSDVTRVFFVGTGISGLPSLFVYESICGFLTVADGCLENAVANELVEGVESMQVVYGVDSDGDGVANQYLAADEIVAPADLTDVVTVRVSLLLRANEFSEAVNPGETFTLADNVEIVPVNQGQGTLRFVSTATVELRSRGD